MTQRNLVQENRDYLIKQSEMLQAIISRMASNSLIIKQLGLTIWTTLVGVGFTNKIKPLFVLALIAFTLLGFLDGYYLYLENRFRVNFKQLTDVIICFDMKVAEDKLMQFKGNFIALDRLSKKQLFQAYFSALRSWASFPYMVTIVITIVILIIT